MTIVDVTTPSYERKFDDSDKTLLIREDLGVIAKSILDHLSEFQSTSFITWYNIGLLLRDARNVCGDGKRYNVWREEAGFPLTRRSSELYVQSANAYDAANKEGRASFLL